MAIPYPGSATRVHSQNTDHSVGLATRYIEQNLDRHVTWDEARAWLEAQRSDTKGTPADWLLLAVLDLEWTGAIQYDKDSFRRPGLPTDAKYAPLEEVAQAVLALDWPRPSDGKRSRTIHQCFLELGGRYRHCDVYWAMHELLKGKRLACHRAYWSLLGDEAILADPTLAPAQRPELEKIVEGELSATATSPRWTIAYSVSIRCATGERTSSTETRGLAISTRTSSSGTAAPSSTSRSSNSSARPGQRSRGHT